MPGQDLRMHHLFEGMHMISQQRGSCNVQTRLDRGWAVWARRRGLPASAQSQKPWEVLGERVPLALGGSLPVLALPLRAIQFLCDLDREIFINISQKDNIVVLWFR